MSLKKEIINRLDVIYTVTEEYKNSGSINFSLLGGSGLAGLNLFSILYQKHILKTTEFNTETCVSIQQMVEGMQGFSYPTFCSGKAGTYWFFNHLYQIAVFDEEDLLLATEDDHQLVNQAIEMIRKDNCDFLHGGIGIMYYVLSNKPEKHLKEFELFFEQLDILKKKSITKSFFPNYDFESAQVDPLSVNFGLAHGIPSILKFCIECFNKNICKEVSRQMGKQIVQFIKENKNKNTDKCYYNSVLTHGIPAVGSSRLAWCYGDLSLAYILYQAGLAFMNNETIDYAMEILLKTTKRLSFEETNVWDTGICHGSAGIAHIYHRMWHYTQNPLFKNATDFWIKKTLDSAVHEDGAAGYKKYNPKDSIWQKDFGLLEGSAGIGLVLLSYITEDMSWDYCLMLND